MDFMEFLTQYAVFPIAIVCFGLGYLIKHFIKPIPNKFIPLILAVVGLILNLSINRFQNITIDMCLVGVGSGLAATGSFEAITNLYKKEQNKQNAEKEQDDKSEVNKNE